LESYLIGLIQNADQQFRQVNKLHEDSQNMTIEVLYCQSSFCRDHTARALKADSELHCMLKCVLSLGLTPSQKHCFKWHFDRQCTCYEHI